MCVNLNLNDGEGDGMHIAKADLHFHNISTESTNIQITEIKLVLIVKKKR